MIKLLIVDDEKIIRETLLKHIPWEALGIRVIGTAQNGLEAYGSIPYHQNVETVFLSMA